MKRRSATSYATSRESLVYFVDRDLGAEVVPAALRDAGVAVEILADHFPKSETPDVTWIPYAAARGWVILTQDRGIRRHPHERAMVVAAKARYFCVAGGSRTGPETAAMIVNHLRTIERIVRRADPPIIASVTMGGVNLFDPGAGNWTAVRTRRSDRR